MAGGFRFVDRDTDTRRAALSRQASLHVMNITINYRLCAIRFSSKPSAEVLRGLRAEDFQWRANIYSWVRPEGWNGLPDDFCDWLVSTADPAPVGPTDDETTNAALTAGAEF